MIWDRMLDGMCAGAWVLGLLLVLGLAALLLWLLVLAFTAAFGQDGEEAKGDGMPEGAERAKDNARGVAGGVRPPVYGDRHSLRDRRGADT